MRAKLHSIFDLAISGFVVVAFIETLRGDSIWFRGFFFAGFVACVLAAANVGDILSALQSNQARLLRAKARADGHGVDLSRELGDSGRKAVTNLVRAMAVSGAALSFGFALSGIPALPAGTVLAFLLTLPFVGPVLFFTLGTATASRGMVALSAKITAAEAMHASLNSLVSQIEAKAGERAEGALVLVTIVVATAVADIARKAETVSLEISIGSIEEAPEAQHRGLAYWTKDIQRLLDNQPIERAQAWLDQLLAGADSFATAATNGGGFSFKLIVDPD